MSIIIHFTPTSTLLSSTTVPSTPACVIDAETTSLDMGPALENDSSLSIMSPDDSSMVDVSTSDSYSGKTRGHSSISYHTSLGTCFGLPYQDHNYGAPPPPTPPSRSPQMSPIPVVTTDIDTETVSSEAVAALHSEEVTETSITRCVCGFDHDDEYMICCDRCLVWQHVDCMGLDRNKIPETYLCEKCEPRRIDRQKAKLLQAKKKVALTGRFLYGDTSEESDDDRKDKNQNFESIPKTRSKSSKRKTEDGTKSDHCTRKGKSKHGKERMEIKRSKFRRKTKSKSESVYIGDEAAQDTWKCSPDSNKLKDESSESSSETHQQMQNLGATLRSQMDEARGSKQLQDQLCKLVEISGNQKKLVAAVDLPKDQIIIEFKGQFVSATQFHQKNPVFSQKQFPFILFYKLRSHEELCVDASENGNDARFARRSCAPNAEIRHLVSNGALHLYISSIKSIAKDEEITVPFDVNFKDCLHEVECACNTDNCFIIKQKKRSESGDRKRRGRKQPYSTDDDSNHSLVENHITSPTKSIKNSPLKANSPTKVMASTSNSNQGGESSDTNITPEDPLNDEHVKEQRKKMTREERKIDAIMRAFDQMEKAAKRKQQALDRQAHQKALHPKSEEITEKQDVVSISVKEEEDKQTNADNSSSVDDEKPTTSTQPSKHKKGKRRRGSGNPVRRRTRTSSGGSDVFTADDNATAGDSTTPILSTTSNIEVADIISPEAEIMSLVLSPPSLQSTPVLPKTKRFLHNEWLQEKEFTTPATSPLTVNTDTNYNLITPPAKLYVQCTKSNPLCPGGISAAHLRRNSIIGPGKLSSSQGSAKKRWLRQAMYEPVDAISVGGISMAVVNGEVSSPLHTLCLSPNSENGIPGIVTVDDVITPLKKRRLMRKSVESSSSDWIGVSSEISPDNSSCDSTIDSSAESAFATSLSAELLKSDTFLSKDDEKISTGGNGVGQHLLKTLRENWIKHDMKSKGSDAVNVENNTDIILDQDIKPSIQSFVSEIKFEKSENVSDSTVIKEHSTGDDALVKATELSQNLVLKEPVVNNIENFNETQESVKTESSKRQETVKTEINEMQEIVKTEINEMQETVKTEINETQESVKTEINETQETVKIEINEKQETVKTEINEKEETVKTEINETQETVKAEINETQETVKAETNETQRSIKIEIIETQESVKIDTNETQNSVKAETNDDLKTSIENNADLPCTLSESISLPTSMQNVAQSSDFPSEPSVTDAINNNITLLSNNTIKNDLPLQNNVEKIEIEKPNNVEDSKCEEKLSNNVEHISKMKDLLVKSNEKIVPDNVEKSLEVRNGSVLESDVLSIKESHLRKNNSVESPIKNSSLPITPKRKVSLSEYRQRRRDNPSPVKANAEKRKTNNCVLNVTSSLEDYTDAEIKLTALPMFKSFMSRAEQNCLREKRSFKRDFLDDRKRTPSLSSSSMFMKPRENLDERLKRELGIGNDNDSHNHEPKLPSLEKVLKKTLSPITPLLSLTSPPSPPPPPPPPRTPIDKAKSSKFNSSAQLQSHSQLPPFTSSQVASHPYLPTSNPIPSSVIPNVHGITPPLLPPGAPPASSTYSSAITRPLSYPVANNQSFSAQQQQVSLTQPSYHFMPQVFK